MLGSNSDARVFTETTPPTEGTAKELALKPLCICILEVKSDRPAQFDH